MGLSGDSILQEPELQSETCSAPSVVVVGTSAVVLLAENFQRKRCVLQNVGTTRIYLAFGAVPTGDAFHVALPAGGTSGDGSSPPWVDELWTGQIQAISSAAGGEVAVAEFT